MTGYHYNPPFGLDVPEGHFFNPYAPNMITDMPPQLHDGMLEYDDGTPASVPQMAHDVSEFLSYLSSYKTPDTKIVMIMTVLIGLTFFPIGYLFSKYQLVNAFSHRFEVYAVKNGGYKKFRE